MSLVGVDVHGVFDESFCLELAVASLESSEDKLKLLNKHESGLLEPNRSETVWNRLGVGGLELMGECRCCCCLFVEAFGLLC